MLISLFFVLQIMYVIDDLWIIHDLEKYLVKTLRLKQNFYNEQPLIIILLFNAPTLKPLILHNIYII